MHPINIFLTYVIVGLAAAIYFYFILKKYLIGKFWGALVVGFVGSFLGGVINHFFGTYLAELSRYNDVNIFASLIAALILLWVFSKVSSHK
ncbi:MAG: GlsB/YeaQ/YmgE family stress response membrane protein [Spirochaetales bacterium]|nr:GlsB/YeaQ/YmgE family stress response membrane protein [Spirochaetales bacterium]